jgi:hypothetical protein
MISSTAQTSRAATSDRMALSYRRLPVSGWRVGLLHPHDQLRVIVCRFDREQHHLAACSRHAESPTRARRSPSPLFGRATVSTKRNVMLCHRQQRIDGSRGVWPGEAVSFGIFSIALPVIRYVIFTQTYGYAGGPTGSTGYGRHICVPLMSEVGDAGPA